MNTVKPSIPSLLLEQIALGELDAQFEKQLRETHGEQSVNDALLVLRESDKALRKPDFSATLIRRVEQGVEREQHRARTMSSSRSWSLTLAPALVAASVWLVVDPLGVEPSGAPASTAMLANTLEVTRLKGDSQDSPAKSHSKAKRGAGELLIYRQVGRKASANKPPRPSVEQLKHGDEVSKGDVLQMGYVSNYEFGMLLSLDGRGQVTLHWPTDKNANPRLPQRESLLDFSYELDDSPEFERFFFVAGPEAFSVKEVAAAANKLGHDSHAAARDILPVAAGLFVTSLTLQKVSQ